MSGQPNGGAALIMQQIKYILDSVDELKEMVKGLDARMRAVELSEAGCQAINQSKIDNALNRIQSVERRVDVIERKMPLLDELLGIKNKLFVLVAVSGFVGTAVGGLVIALLFDLMVGGG